jgi:DNA-binding NtrC family response regulator
VTAFHPDAIRALGDYDWPGNVRELQHVVERAIILTKGGIIGVDDLPDEVLRLKPDTSVSSFQK